MTPAERLRQHQRALAKAQRELDRERTKLEQQERKLVADIKKSAKAGQLVSLQFPFDDPSFERDCAHYLSILFSSAKYEID